MTVQPNDLTRTVFLAEAAAVNEYLAQAQQPDAVPSVPAETDLRERVARALYAHDHPGHLVPLAATGMEPAYLETADAVLAALPAPADRAARRERYAAAIRDTSGWVLDEGQHMIDAVMAVADIEHAAEVAHLRHLLSTENKRANDAIDREEVAEQAALEAQTDRAAVLREAVEVAGQMGGRFGTDDHGDHDAGWNDACAAIQVELRQMADEAQQGEAHPAEHTWAAELHDPVADEWVPGTRYTARDRAVNHLDHANTVGPTWKDGTPTRRRLVRATTTYTVEQPADEAQQAGEGR